MTKIAIVEHVSGEQGRGEQVKTWLTEPEFIKAAFPVGGSEVLKRLHSTQSVLMKLLCIRLRSTVFQTRHWVRIS